MTTDAGQDGFEHLRRWTDDLAAIHEAMSDPIWERLGKRPRGTAADFQLLLRATMEELGLDWDDDANLDEVMHAITLAAFPPSTSRCRNDDTAGDGE